MKFVAWIWCCLMLAGAALIEQAGTFGFAVPRNLQLGMIFSTVLILPPLWQRDGMLADAGLPGMSRAVLAIMLPIVCGMIGTSFGIDTFVAPPILV